MTADPLFQELAEVLDSPRDATWLLEELEALAPQERRARAISLARRREAGEPLQYLVGHWPFRTIDLLVDQRALIPRPETELLVDLALAAVMALGDGAIVGDLGCGTGAIALSIAVEARARGTRVEVVATDVSSDAVALARQNATRSGAEPITFCVGSWFDALPSSYAGAIAVLCSNPPYVAANERPGLARELDFEPQLALVADDGADGTPGLAAIEHIIAGARPWLIPGGTLLVEHGAAQRIAVVERCARAGLVDVRAHDDLAGLPRFIEARRPR